MFVTTPAPLGFFTFRHFIEHVVNCATRFQNASGIAYASQVLAGLDDAPGAVSELSDRGVALLVESLTDEANELPAPPLTYREGENEPVPVPWTAHRAFIGALTGATKNRPAPTAAAPPETAAEPQPIAAE